MLLGLDWVTLPPATRNCHCLTNPPPQLGICLMNLFVDQGQTISPWFPTRPTGTDHDRAKVSLSLSSASPDERPGPGDPEQRVAAVSCDQDPGPVSRVCWPDPRLRYQLALLTPGTLSCFSTLKPWRHHLLSLSLSSVSKTPNIVNIDIYAWESHDTGHGTTVKMV